MWNSISDNLATWNILAAPAVVDLQQNENEAVVIFNLNQASRHVWPNIRNQTTLQVAKLCRTQFTTTLLLALLLCLQQSLT